MHSLAVMKKKIKPEVCLHFFTLELNLEEGNFYDIPVFAKNYKEILGFRFTLEYDSSKFNIFGIQNRAFPIENYDHINGAQHLMKLSILHISATELTFGPEERLFTIHIQMKEDLNSKDLFKVNNYPTYSIAYDSSETPMDICFESITTSQENLKKDQPISLYPNPVNHRLFIENNTSSPLNRVQIFNQYGQLVYFKYLGNFQKIYEINVEEILSPGVYYIKYFMNNKESVTKFIKD